MKHSKTTTAVLLASMLLCGFTQSYLRSQKTALSRKTLTQDIPERKNRIAGMDSYAVGLVLGGLRGPLVMALWSSSENQKMDQNLQSINTKIELIRILQPNFDSVHIFQMWNKAFNLSAQMTSIKDKYSVILDALKYGEDIDRDRPDNINILSSIARIYIDKLCHFEDKSYFDHRVRSESLPGKSSQLQNSRIPSQKFPTLLDETGRILPEHLKPGLDQNLGSYNGAALQYLQKYNDNAGFPYGIPPAALAFNYYRRCAELLHNSNQKHAEISDAILSSRDLYCLGFWAQDEEQRAQKLEASVYGKTPKYEIIELAKAAQSIPPDAPFAVDKSAAKKIIDEALFSLRRSHEVAQDAIKDYQVLIDKDPLGARAPSNRQHLDDNKVILSNSIADGLYLRLVAFDAGFLPLPESTVSRDQLIQQAKTAYTLSYFESYRVMLSYMVDEDLATEVYVRILGEKPSRTPGRWTLDNIDPNLFPKMRTEYEAELQRVNREDNHFTDVEEYKAHINRANERLKILSSLK